MLNFKQYLLKEENPLSFPYLVLELENKEGFGEASGFSVAPRYRNYFDDTVDKFVDGLKQHLGIKDIDYMFNRDDNLQVEIKLNNRQYVQDELDEISLEAARYCNNELSSGFNSVEDVNPNVYFYGLPANSSVIIHYPVIAFDLHHSQKSIALSNFDKHFPDTQVFQFLNSKNKVTNVLSLLKIPALHSVIARGEIWSEIVSKHAKSKDLLACQIELIENDLEEYAIL